MKKFRLATMAGTLAMSAALILGGCGSTTSSTTTTTAQYSVTITNQSDALGVLKTKANANVIDGGGLNMSPFAVISHKTLGAIWSTSKTAPAGLVHIAEWGKSTSAGINIAISSQNVTLNSDTSMEALMNTLISSGEGLAKVITDGVGGPGGSVTFTITVDSAHPYVSLAGMLAPSADFFTGTDVSLLDSNGQFVTSTTAALPGYSAESRSSSTVDFAVQRGNTGLKTNENVVLPADKVHMLGTSAHVPQFIKNQISVNTSFGTVTFTKL